MKRSEIISLSLFVLAIGFMRAWALTFLRTSGVSFPLSQLSAGTIFVAAPTLLFSMIAFTFLSVKKSFDFLEPRWLVIAAGCLVAGTGLLSLSGTTPFFGQFLACVGFALLLLQCGAVSFLLSTKKLVLGLCGGYVFAAAICLTLALLDAMYFAFLFSLLGALACLCLGLFTLTYQEQAKEKKLSFIDLNLASKAPSAKKNKNLLLRMFFAILLMELVARSSLMISAEFAVRQLSYLGISFEVARFTGTLVTLVVFGVVLKFSKVPLRVSYNIVPVLLVASCLILLPSQLNLTYVTYTVAFSAGAFFEITIWILAVKSHRCINARPITIWAAGRVAFWLSTFMGLALWSWQSLYYENGITGDYPALCTLVVMMGLVVVLTYCLILPITSISTLGIMQESRIPAGSEQEMFTQIIEKLSESAGLSARETEIFALLGRGRSTTYISEALYISTGTVGSHRDRIYRKLGIHSKQELFDLIERERNIS